MSQTCVCGLPIIRTLGRKVFKAKCQGHTFREIGFSQNDLYSIAKPIAEWYTRAEELTASKEGR